MTKPITMRKIALILTAVAVPVAGGALAAPASAQNELGDACTERLDTGERKTYRFKNGSRSLSWARVVVTPTRANEDRYCIQVRFGGRKPNHKSSSSGYERRNGRWVHIGDDGGGAEPTRSYTRTFQIPEGRRTVQRLDVRHGGRWYRATFSLQNP